MQAWFRNNENMMFAGINSNTIILNDKFPGKAASENALIARDAQKRMLVKWLSNYKRGFSC
jgi:hypothetical protein